MVDKNRNGYYAYLILKENKPYNVNLRLSLETKTPINTPLKCTILSEGKDYWLIRVEDGWNMGWVAKKAIELLSVNYAAKN